MSAKAIEAKEKEQSLFLSKNFNKKKFTINYPVTTNQNLLEIHNLAKVQCLGKTLQPQIEKVIGWMIFAEPAPFMKCGALVMISSEFTESFTNTF